VLLYGSKTWKTTQEIVRKLRLFTYKCLHIILGIRWPQKVTNLEVRKICNQEDIMVSLRRKWTWIGHVLRKDPSDIAKEGLFWTPEGKRQRGRPRTTWRRSTEKELKTIYLTWSEIRKAAQDRSRWRETVKALCVRWRDVDADFVLKIKRVENYPGFEKLAHVIQHGLQGFMAKNIEGESTEANDLSHIL